MAKEKIKNSSIKSVGLLVLVYLCIALVLIDLTTNIADLLEEQKAVSQEVEMQLTRQVEIPATPEATPTRVQASPTPTPIPTGPTAVPSATFAVEDEA